MGSSAAVCSSPSRTRCPSWRPERSSFSRRRSRGSPSAEPATIARGTLLRIGTGMLAVALTGGTFVRSMPLAAVALIAGGLGASSFVALAYPFFAELVGEERQGEYTGLWMFSVGFGRIVAPMLTGGIIDLGKHFMSKTKGYPLMWTTAGLVTAIGWVLLMYALHVAAKHGFEDRAAEARSS